MRILPSDEQQSRKEKILQAVIHLYIRSGKPVGSAAIVESFKLNLSPATIRNVLAELEREGYLTHPHTSAGRVPTDIGYQVYVGSLLKIQRLADEERLRIEREYHRRIQEVEDLMQSTTRILSTLSHCAGFAMTPLVEEDRLRRVDLIPISSNQVLGVMVAESGMVRNHMINTANVPDEKTLRIASQFLSRQLSGVNLSQAQRRLSEELEKFHGQRLQQEDFLKQVANHLFDNEQEGSVFVEGASNMFEFPEFQDIKSIRNFAQLVDKKQALAQIFYKELDKKGVQVRIGINRPPELKDLSVVSSSYTVRGRPLGVIGILGPKRMEYQRMMAIVNTVSELVNQFLTQSETDLLEG